MGCRETEQICHQVSGAQFSSRPSGEKTKLGPKLDTIPTLVGMYHYNYNHNYDYNYHYNYNYNSIHIIYIYTHTLFYIFYQKLIPILVYFQVLFSSGSRPDHPGRVLEAPWPASGNVHKWGTQQWMVNKGKSHL